MLSLDNETPFEGRAVPLRDKEGHPVAVFVIKGTYEFKPDGSCVPAKEPAAIVEADEYYGEPGISSVRLESDLAIFKPSTDVVVVGSAIAPGERPVRQLTVSFSVGSMARSISVFGNRRWQVGLVRTTASEPEEFTQLPLTFENAFGGKDATHKDERKHDWDKRNPIGKGFRVNASNDKEEGKALDGWPLPNLEDPGALIRSWQDKPVPVAPGFLSRSWADRVRYAGTYDEAWIQKRCPILPPDFDYKYFQAAPPAQISPEYLQGGELVKLKHLTPQGEVAFNLPKVTLGLDAICLKAIVQRQPVLDTVVLHTDKAQCILVWRCSVRYRQSLDDLGPARIYFRNV